MKKHLFLTGEKRVGKSTLLKQILEKHHGAIGGFFTVKSNEVLADCVSVHLLRAGTADVPTEENLLFICRAVDDQVMERFDRMGCAALTERQDVTLLVMDELGPHEVNARVFQRTVRQALDGTIPILGILQKADSVFLKEIAEHPEVKLVEVTKENRDLLAVSVEKTGWL